MCKIDKIAQGKQNVTMRNCLNANQKDKILTIKKLYDHVIQSDGGFDIGKFIGRRKIDKK